MCTSFLMKLGKIYMQVLICIYNGFVTRDLSGNKLHRNELHIIIITTTLIYSWVDFESIKWIFKKLKKKSPLIASLNCKMIFLHFRKNARLKIRNKKNRKSMGWPFAFSVYFYYVLDHALRVEYNFTTLCKWIIFSTA